MKAQKTVLFLLLLAFVFSPGKARSYLDHLEFNQFSTFNGLPNNMVHQVYQDRDGYIWIATYYGLFKYDGYEIQTIKSNLYTPGLLTNNNVVCVKEDHSHQLWIGTHEGLCILDKRTGVVRKMKLEGVNRHRLNQIHVTEDNNIYLGYIRGMARYDALRDTVILMTRENSLGDVPEKGKYTGHSGRYEWRPAYRDLGRRTFSLCNRGEPVYPLSYGKSILHSFSLSGFPGYYLGWWKWLRPASGRVLCR
ncbi:MAG: hypothetical protein LUE93_14660 [Bacteroides sp.]|nr:hypothetical protein [Bacteroides sp.]